MFRVYRDATADGGNGSDDTGSTPAPAAAQPPAPPAQPETPPVENGDSTGKGKDEVVMPRDTFNERLRRAEDAAMNKLLKELEGESLDEVKKGLAELKQVREAQQTDLEKAQSVVDKLTKRAEEAEAKIQQMQAETRKRTLDDAIKAVAKELNASEPSDVVLWLRNGDQSDVLDTMMDEDGAIDAKAVKKGVEAAQKERPHWFQVKSKLPGSPSNSDGTTAPTEGDRNAAAVAQAVRTKQRGW